MFSVSEYSALRAGILKAWGSFDPMEVGRRKNESSRPVHRLDEPTGISLGMVASPQCPLPFRRQGHFSSATTCRFFNIRLAR